MSSKTTVPDRYYTPQLPKKPVVDHSEAYQPTPKPDTVYIDENLRVSNNDFCCFSCLTACIFCFAVKGENRK